MKLTDVHATSQVLQVLWQEIAELSHRYLAALDQIRQLDPERDEDEYAKCWAELDTTLFLIELKGKDARREMERLEDTLPD